MMFTHRMRGLSRSQGRKSPVLPEIPRFWLQRGGNDLRFM